MDRSKSRPFKEFVDEALRDSPEFGVFWKDKQALSLSILAAEVRALREAYADVNALVKAARSVHLAFSAKYAGKDAPQDFCTECDIHWMTVLGLEAALKPFEE